MTNYRQLLFALPMLTILGSIATGCKHTSIVEKPSVSPIEDPAPIKTTSDKLVSLRSLWMEYQGKKPKNATIVFIPGSGNPGLEGSRAGDGISNYSSPINIGSLWQESFAKSGFNILAYDKRVDTSGPTALGNDLDSACEAVKKRFGKNQKVVLFTSDLGTQVVLSSRCKENADAIVIFSPIPDTLDVLWTSALKEAGFNHRAESLIATFEAIHSGLFEPDAKIMGESLTFWTNWLAHSKISFKKLKDIKSPLLFLVGEKDAYVGRNGLQILENLTKSRKNRKLLKISRADRNLLEKEALSQRTIGTTISALKELVN